MPVVLYRRPLMCNGLNFQLRAALTELAKSKGCPHKARADATFPRRSTRTCTLTVPSTLTPGSLGYSGDTFLIALISMLRYGVPTRSHVTTSRLNIDEGMEITRHNTRIRRSTFKCGCRLPITQTFHSSRLHMLIIIHSLLVDLTLRHQVTGF
jgi:hypothetical protein